MCPTKSGETPNGTGRDAEGEGKGNGKSGKSGGKGKMKSKPVAAASSASDELHLEKLEVDLVGERTSPRMRDSW